MCTNSKRTLWKYSGKAHQTIGLKENIGLFGGHRLVYLIKKVVAPALTALHVLMYHIPILYCQSCIICYPWFSKQDSRLNTNKDMRRKADELTGKPWWLVLLKTATIWLILDILENCTTWIVTATATVHKFFSISVGKKHLLLFKGSYTWR